MSSLEVSTSRPSAASKTTSKVTQTNIVHAKETIGPIQGFFIGGAAACTAVTFTNPWELVKTRLQLQGELANSTSKPYKNIFQSFYVVLKYEGLRGIQRGLGPAYAYQLVMNGARLGLYDPIRHSLVKTFNSSSTSIPLSIAAGGLAGVVGAALGSPLFLVKTRMQARSSHVPIGHQHRYKNTFDALIKISQQGGIRGLFRGVDASMIRTGVGSSTQLPSYFYIKRWIMEKTGMSEGDIFMHAFSSLLSGFCVCVTMNPFDVISTRMYNQKADSTGKGSLYKNTLDCFIKTVRAEGIMSLYKGFGAHYLRIGPHTILTLVFLEQYRALYIRYTHR